MEIVKFNLGIIENIELLCLFVIIDLDKCNYIVYISKIYKYCRENVIIYVFFYLFVIYNKIRIKNFIFNLSLIKYL